MTYGIFTDQSCTTVSPSVTLSDYIVMSYYAYYGSNEKGREVAATYETAIEVWNEKMVRIYLDTHVFIAFRYVPTYTSAYASIHYEGSQVSYPHN